MQSNGVVHVGFDVVAAQIERLHVGGEELFFAFVLLGKELFKNIGVDAQQQGECANVDDVLKELALAGLFVVVVADLGQGHTNDVKILSELGRGDGA